MHSALNILPREILTIEPLDIEGLNSDQLLNGDLQVVAIQLPQTMVWLGGLLVIMFTILFVRTLQIKLKAFEVKKISPLPLGNFYTVTSWIGTLSGLTILFTGGLQIYNFSALNSLIASLVLALSTGIPMWNVVKNLLSEIETGTIKEIDQYF